MLRRVSLTLILLTVLANGGWAKINKDDKAYVDEKIQAITYQLAETQKQLAALTAELKALGKQLNDLQNAQADFHQTLQHQEESLNDLLASLNIMRQSHAADMGSITDRLSLLSNQITGMLSSASPIRPATEISQPAVPVATPAASPSVLQEQIPAGPGQIEGYVTAINGPDLTVGLGSAQGLRVGSKLALYKKGDSHKQVGQLEVTSIVDESNCHAKILTLDDGVQPEFSDIVRAVQE